MSGNASLSSSDETQSFRRRRQLAGGHCGCCNRGQLGQLQSIFSEGDGIAHLQQQKPGFDDSVSG